MMTNGYMRKQLKGKRTRWVVYYMCPFCGYEHVVEVNRFVVAYVNARGEFVCAKCKKGFKVSIDEKIKKRIDKYKEKRRRVK